MYGIFVINIFSRLHFWFCFRYWAIAVPTYVCVALVFAIVLYVAYNFTITPPLDSISTITGIFHANKILYMLSRSEHFIAMNLWCASCEYVDYCSFALSCNKSYKNPFV